MPKDGDDDGDNDSVPHYSFSASRFYGHSNLNVSRETSISFSALRTRIAMSSAVVTGDRVLTAMHRRCHQAHRPLLPCILPLDSASVDTSNTTQAIAHKINVNCFWVGWWWWRLRWRKAKRACKRDACAPSSICKPHRDDGDIHFGPGRIYRESEELTAAARRKRRSPFIALRMCMRWYIIHIWRPFCTQMRRTQFAWRCKHSSVRAYVHFRRPLGAHPFRFFLSSLSSQMLFRLSGLRDDKAAAQKRNVVHIFKYIYICKETDAVAAAAAVRTLS